MDLKSSLRKGTVSIGSWITLANTSIVEIMAAQGFQWLVIDMEHSAISLSEAQQLLQIIELSGITPLVRVSDNDHTHIKRVMDAGAHGVIVPMVNSAEDAEAAVAAVKYPPLGKRGVGLGRAQGYGLEFKKYKEWVNSSSIVIVQIEHINAIRNLKEILNVDGVDASIIGPYDLSASLGSPGEFSRKEVQAAIAEYVRVCKRLTKPAGFHVIPPEADMLNQKIKEGYLFLGFSLDTLFLGEKVRKELKEIKRK